MARIVVGAMRGEERPAPWRPSVRARWAAVPVVVLVAAGVAYRPAVVTGLTCRSGPGPADARVARVEVRGIGWVTVDSTGGRWIGGGVDEVADVGRLVLPGRPAEFALDLTVGYADGIDQAGNWVGGPFPGPADVAVRAGGPDGPVVDRCRVDPYR